MQYCSICGSAVFDDMDTCYNCLTKVKGEGEGPASFDDTFAQEMDEVYVNETLEAMAADYEDYLAQQEACLAASFDPALYDFSCCADSSCAGGTEGLSMGIVEEETGTAEIEDKVPSDDSGVGAGAGVGVDAGARAEEGMGTGAGTGAGAGEVAGNGAGEGAGTRAGGAAGTGAGEVAGVGVGVGVGVGGDVRAVDDARKTGGVLVCEGAFHRDGIKIEVYIPHEMLRS